MVRPPYPVVIRLCCLLAERWAEIDAAYYQIDLLNQRPSRILGLVYAWAIVRIADEDRDDWLADLADLLPWQDTSGEAAAEIESASFMAMMQKG